MGAQLLLQTMQDILADLVKNRTGRIGKWQYLTDMEADTDIHRIQHMQPVMLAFAKFRNDLRISQKELAKACYHVMNTLIRHRGKDLKTFAIAQAFILRESLADIGFEIGSCRCNGPKTSVFLVRHCG
jgi:nitric oxide reductase activation protein